MRTRTTLLLAVTALLVTACTDQDTRGEPDPEIAPSDPVNGPGEDNGFGADLIFDSAITTPWVVARSACSGLGIAAGDRLMIVAQEDWFLIERADETAAVQILVPAQGDYVWQGQSPNRVTNEVVSSSLHLDITLDTDTADVTVTQVGAASARCVLSRCPAYGTCE